MDAVDRLLLIAFAHSITEPNIEAGFDRFRALTVQDTASQDWAAQDVAAQNIGFQTFCEAVAECLRDDLIREPIRLPAGALQCHWHLELTPSGVAAARVRQSLTSSTIPPRG